MRLMISMKHLDHSEALDLKIKEKSEKLNKFLHDDYRIHWVCWVNEGQHWAEAKVHSSHNDFFAKASSENMYQSLEKVVDKLERQLERQKDEKNKIHRKQLEIA